MPQIPEDVKVGDKFYTQHGFNGFIQLRTIAKVTPTLVVDESGTKWRREDGRRSPMSCVDYSLLLPYTKEIEEQQRQRKIRQEALSFVEKFDFKRLSLEKLLKVKEVLEQSEDNSP